MKISRSFALTLFIFSLPVFASDAPKAAGDHAPASRMTGWEAFSEMQNGNVRFFEGKAKHPNQDSEKRESLAAGQKPHTIILSCSDSRVPPETIFDQGLGDVFTVRLAGNVVNAEAIASIEYAVAHLGPKFILFMGHESCGAIGAAIGSKPGITNGSESLDQLVGKIRANLSSTAVSAGATDKSFRQGVKENVSSNMKELLARSEIVRSAVKKDGLVIGHGIYSLKTGKVEFWDMTNKLEAAGVPDAPAILEQRVVQESIVTTPTNRAKKTIKNKTPKAPAHEDAHAH